MAGLATCIEKKVPSTLARMTAQGKGSGFRVQLERVQGSGFGVQDFQEDW
jgi:hypothetical protein